MLFLLIIGILVLIVVAYLQLPVFGANPLGERLARIQKSPNYQNGKFQNLSDTPMLTSDKSVIRATFDMLFGADKRVKPRSFIPSVKTDLNTLPKDQDYFVWFGHSSYLLNINSKTFLIDPVLVSATPLPFGGKAFKGADIYQPSDIPSVDYLIISHDHYDHLDYDTIKIIKDRIGQVVTGLGNGSHFERWGFSPNQLIELDWYQDITLDDLTITALPTRHSSGRALKQNQTLWASFMVQTGSKTVYVGGDSGYDVFFKEIAHQFPRIDVAIMENGQYDKDWANIHFLPDDLVKAVKDLNPQKLVAVHNSKFVLAKHAWDEPMRRLSQSAEQENLPLLTPKIGEVFYLDDHPQFEKWWEGVE
ncbi:MBL fold metallo-hydrolase [Actinobacillus capsulatus]|uniref:MBL fold metallo-hydrolase n=1 Tax=Actinobacillus capsulatus TaxID=717 RepID=UPI00037BB9CE|nr:MBL fold metallo-hydrolase [Actinobacillus capsulatus]